MELDISGSMVIWIGFFSLEIPAIRLAYIKMKFKKQLLCLDSFTAI